MDCHSWSLHLSLFMHSLLASSIPPSLLTFTWMYSFTLSFQLTTGLPVYLGPSVSLTYTFLTNSSLFFLSIWPNHFNLFLFTHSTTSHHYICTGSHITSFIALTFPSCHAVCSSEITHFHSTHSWLLYPIPCSSLGSIHQCWQKKTVPWTVFISMDTFFLITLASDPVTYLPFTALSYFSFHLSMFAEHCSQILKLFHFLHFLLKLPHIFPLLAHTWNLFGR